MQKLKKSFTQVYLVLFHLPYSSDPMPKSIADFGSIEAYVHFASAEIIAEM